MFRKFLTLDFLFFINPLVLDKTDKFFALISICFIALSVGLKLFCRASKNIIVKKILQRLFNLCATIGFSGVLWFGARYQNVKFFGSHFVFIIIMLIALVWFGFIAYYFFSKFRNEKIAWEKEQLKFKYINR